MGNTPTSKLQYEFPRVGNTVLVDGEQRGIITRIAGAGVAAGLESGEEDLLNVRPDATAVTHVRILPGNDGEEAKQQKGAGAEATTEVRYEQTAFAPEARAPFVGHEEEAATRFIQNLVGRMLRGEIPAPGSDEPATVAAEHAELVQTQLSDDKWVAGFLTMAFTTAGRNWEKIDLTAVSASVHKALCWRLENKSSELLGWDVPKDLLRQCPGGLFGRARDGKPILWVMGGLISWHTLKAEEITKLELWRQELMTAELEQTGGRDVYVVVDMSAVSMSMLRDVSKFGNLSVVSESYYPGRSAKTLLINCPPMITNLYSFVKHFLSAHSQNLVAMFQAGEPTTAGLLQYMESDSIPRFYGGTATGEDPDDDFCTERLFPGGFNDKVAAIAEARRKQAQEPVASE